MNPLPQTHHEKLVEVANTLSSLVDVEFEKGRDPWITDEFANTPLYKLWKGLADHLLYYDTLTTSPPSSLTT